MRGARRFPMDRSRHSTAGDMARHMDILGIERPVPRSSVPAPSIHDSGKRALLRIVKQDELKTDLFDASTLQVQFVWMERDQSLKMEDSVREKIQSMRAKPVVRSYLRTVTMEEVLRDCEGWFKPQDVKLVLLADGKVVEGRDSFCQLVSARRLVISSIPASEGKFYTLQLRLQDPPAAPASSGPVKTFRSVSTSPVRDASNAEEKTKRRSSDDSGQGGKRPRVEEEPLPVPVQVGSLKELLEPLMVLGAIKKLTISMELIDGERITLTGEL